MEDRPSGGPDGGLLKQDAWSVADPGVADRGTSRVPCQRPDALIGSWAELTRWSPWIRPTSTTGEPSALPVAGQGVTDATVTELPGGPAAGVLLKVSAGLAPAALTIETVPTTAKTVPVSAETGMANLRTIPPARAARSIAPRPVLRESIRSRYSMQVNLALGGGW